jgi:hypothetical protein
MGYDITDNPTEATRNKTGQPDGSSDFHVDLAIKAIWRFLWMGDPQMVKWLVYNGKSY